MIYRKISVFVAGFMFLLLMSAAAQQGQPLSGISIDYSINYAGGKLMSRQLLQVVQKPGGITLRQEDISHKTDDNGKWYYEVVTAEGVVPAKAYAGLWAKLESLGVWKMKAVKVKYDMLETNPVNYRLSFQRGAKKNAFSDYGGNFQEKYGKFMKPITALFRKYARPSAMGKSAE